MKFIVNKDQLIKQLSSLSGALSQNTNISSVIDCIHIEMPSSKSTTFHDDALCDSLPTYVMPSIDPYDGPVPTRLVGFNEARCEKEPYGTVHFYLDDSLFECVWNNPSKYVPLLKKYESIIGPDFSQYTDMTYDERYYNAWRNRTLTAEFQLRGINVIPNVTWSLSDSYDYSFSGIPKKLF